MTFALRRLKSGKRPWRLGIQVWEDGKQKDIHVPESRFREYGILPSMTWEEVRDRVKQLNSQEALKRRAARRQKVDERLKEEALFHSAFLPEAEVAAFERDELYRRKHDKKLVSHWKVAKDILCALKLDPSDWEYHRTRFYDLFAEKAYSVSYVQKLIPVINNWGYYQARKHRLPFLPLPYPAGREREAINDAYFEKAPAGNAPAPLTPKMLLTAKERFPLDQYNWLYVSVWFGLRPEEVNNIIKGKHFEIRKIGADMVLAVYQTKLTSLNRDDRWKLIPVTCKEQGKGIEIIKSGSMRPPLSRILAAEFGPRVGLRSGRKNFTDMMLDLGHPLEDISAWLGHTSIQRTWKNYRDRQKLRFTKRAA
jgi:hypothetical protein